MHISLFFTLALPLVGALARPLPGSKADLESRDDTFNSGALNLRSLNLALPSLHQRELGDFENLLVARAKGGSKGGSRGGSKSVSKPPQRQSKQPPKAPSRQAKQASKPAKPKTKPKNKIPTAPSPPKAPSRKVTPAQQAARKNAVKEKVATNQKKNADLRDKAIARKATNPSVKIPRPPRAPTPKGAPKTAKALASQKKANLKTQERKAAGRSKFGAAAAAQRATTKLPNRKNVYNVNEKVDGKLQKVKYTGADARRAVFNSHLHKNDPVNFQPKTFENRPQGPKGNKSKPIPYMKGKGREFPLSQNPAGYKGEAPGAARVIIQPTKNGHEFKGVVAHDASLPPGHPGHHDHFLVHKSKS